MKQKFTRAQLGILITSCANIGIVLGLIVNISGLFFQPIMEELHTGIGKVSTTLAIYNVAFAISGLLFPKIAGRIRYKKLAVAGILGVILTTAATAYCRTLFDLYLMNTLRGLFAGLIGPVACTMIVNRWFLQASGFFRTGRYASRSVTYRKQAYASGIIKEVRVCFHGAKTNPRYLQQHDRHSEGTL